MSVQKPNENRYKAACSVSAMSKLVGLSRASFYGYVKKGVFMAPVYSVTTKRPFYTAEMQAENIAAKNSGIGVNGEYVLWYERRQPAVPPPARQPASRGRYAGLLDALDALGLDKLTAGQVDEAVAANFPDGVEGIEESTLLRVLNRHFRRSGLA